MIYKTGDVVLMGEDRQMLKELKNQFCKIVCNPKNDIKIGKVWTLYLKEVDAHCYPYEDTESFFLQVVKRKATKKESEEFEQKLIEEAL